MPLIPVGMNLSNNTPIETISDENLHFAIQSEFDRLPSKYAAFTLYDRDGAIYDGAGALLNEVPVQAARHRATHFSVSGLSLTSFQSVNQLVEKLKQLHGLADQPINKEPIGFRRQ